MQIDEVTDLQEAFHYSAAHHAELEFSRLEHRHHRVERQFNATDSQVRDQVAAVRRHDDDAVHPPEADDEAHRLRPRQPDRS